MKPFILVVSDKGGAGKSVISRLIGEYFREAGSDCLLVDGDGEVGQLVKHLGKRDNTKRLLNPQPPFEGVLQFSLNTTETDREKIASILDLQADRILVDFPAAGLAILNQTNQKFMFLDDIKSEGYTPVFINPITPFGASMRTVKLMIALGGDDSEYVVVRNGMFVDSDEDWIVWDGSETIRPSAGKAAIAERGRELTLPKLRAGAMALMDEYNLDFLGGSTSELMPRYHRNAVRAWRKSAFEMLANINDLLGVKDAN